MAKKDKNIDIENTSEKDINVQNENSTKNEEKTNNKEKTNNEEKKDNSKINFEEKFNEINDKYLRLSAEFDNYRKRTLKERMEMMKNAGEDILVNFLPIMDNIDRAKQSIDSAKEIGAIKEGINLIHKNITDFLAGKGITEIKAKGETFDTDLHEAITKIPAPEESLKGKVVDVIEKGYKIKDKILRYAKVVVGE